ncbi:MAG: glutamine--fructose-6-phosphate transaminase (isomerizing) [Planctomycetaceae bacterium]|jgi:glucosamine--fructose-6-phosphate aminotransferase (isomerizing)|nr:glutamine--fructose-6-phosphate transaminase (isomerizing) [Planctomycetaceae bacterium]
MCGIVGYAGKRNPVDFLISGLRLLEYRGYDSAGIAVLNSEKNLQIIKSPGRIDVLEKLVRENKPQGYTGIGHTRWATHGLPTAENAHPHSSFDGAVAVVHNGVIENYQSIRATLKNKGIEFKTQTDTESIAHLIAYYLQENRNTAEGAVRITAENAAEELPRIVRLALSQLHGTYGLAVLFRDFPDILIGAKLGSPLILGCGKGENFLTSDSSTLAGNTDRIITLSDHEIVYMTADDYTLHHRDEGVVNRSVEVLDINSPQIDKGGFAHYMLKEIFEQPEAVRNAMRGRLDYDSATAKFGGLNITPQQLLTVQRILMTACGTSWHASLVGEYQIEMLARIPVEVEYASELRYRNPPLDYNTLLFAVTQSGETADTVAALREMKRRGYTAMSICNVIGSSIAREASGGIYLHAGPEVSVASTKTFTSQCTVMALLALYLGRLRHLNFENGRQIIAELERLPQLIEAALQTNEAVKKIAQKYAACESFLFLARQFNFPAALEGALKLKEISYIHAEGYAAGEMKHGPIALIDKNTPSIFIAPKSYVLDKTISNMQEIKARGGPVIALTSEGDRETPELADDVIALPEAADFLQPIIYNIPLQLLAYHIAVERGCDVDRPRNLAKSVTVE